MSKAILVIHAPTGTVLYVLPNPLFPFIWFRTALPRTHPELRIEETPQPFRHVRRTSG